MRNVIQSNEIMENCMRNAKAFVFAAEEDFGITPVEAQACGTPVIAYGKGGVLETIRGMSKTTPTGVFFDKQHVDSIIDAVNKFESNFDLFAPIECRNNAMRFSEERFKNEIHSYVNDKWNDFKGRIEN